MQAYHQAPPAVIRIFDSAEVARDRAFGHGILKTDRPFQPEPSDWAAYREMLDAEQDRQLEHRWLAYQHESRFDGGLTDADLAAAGHGVG
jgi:hypothetical protein